jgi:hypothetical protein
LGVAKDAIAQFERQARLGPVKKLTRFLLTDCLDLTKWFNKPSLTMNKWP